ncbi:hypothetical protein JG688_00006424 [Phytophthora aleatoria]|uniref:Uncharacterized protein n=1 Tax=Phytophthora aleatoria TaxID=2496075 RepID=A0A8J5MGZ3_9STRA|nr:hypothetical protein JG688_00006424 [Phytophthora aleatoria]
MHFEPCASASAQVITTIAQRRKVLQWMVKIEELHGDEKLFSKAMDQFPSIFKSKTRRANVGKAGDWWRKRAQFLEAPRVSTVLSGRRSHGRVRVNRKAIVGRGSCTSPWVIWLYPILRAEFDRLRKAGLKFDAPLLRQVALRQFQAPGATFTEASVHCNGVPLATKVTSRWIQVFMEKHSIVLNAEASATESQSPSTQPGMVIQLARCQVSTLADEVDHRNSSSWALAIRRLGSSCMVTGPTSSALDSFI